MSALEDGVVLGSILRHATVFASHEQYWEYRQKARGKNPDSDATYVCNMATFNKGQYWFNFNWADVYRKGDTDFDGIKAYIDQKVAERKSTRTNQKQKRAATKVCPSLNRPNNRISAMRKATKTKTMRCLLQKGAESKVTSQLPRNPLPQHQPLVVHELKRTSKSLLSIPAHYLHPY
jgi:hypothetical protein